MRENGASPRYWSARVEAITGAERGVVSRRGAEDLAASHSLAQLLIKRTAIG